VRKGIKSYSSFVDIKLSELVKDTTRMKETLWSSNERIGNLPQIKIKKYKEKKP